MPKGSTSQKREKLEAAINGKLSDLSGDQRRDKIMAAMTQGQTLEEFNASLGGASGSADLSTLLTATNDAGEAFLKADGGKAEYEALDTAKQAEVTSRAESFATAETDPAAAPYVKQIAEGQQKLETMETYVRQNEDEGFDAGEEAQVRHTEAGRKYMDALKAKDAQKPETQRKLDSARTAYVESEKDGVRAQMEVAQRELDKNKAYTSAKRDYEKSQAEYDGWQADITDAAEKKDADRLSRLLSTKDHKVKVEATEAGRVAHSEATKNAWGRAGTTLSNPSEVPKGINTTATEVVDMGKTLLKAPGDAVTAWKSLDTALSTSDPDVKATLERSRGTLKAAADKKGRFDDEIGKSRFKDGTTDTIGAKDKKGSGLLAEMLKAHQAKGAEFDDLANQSTEQGGATLKARGEGAAQEALASKTDEEAEKLDIKNDRKAGKFV